MLGLWIEIIWNCKNLLSIALSAIVLIKHVQAWQSIKPGGLIVGLVNKD